jgi:teichuronic acid biosynthesis glycosyltransferase TuaG
MIKISVIMPAFNVESFISEAIESVICQTFTNWELIIIDDGSTDNTSNISKLYEKSDNRIHYIYQANGKQGKARNLGIKNAKGEFIAFLDADDLWIKTKLEIQYNYFLDNKNIDLLFTQGYSKFNDENQYFDISIKRLFDSNDLRLFIEKNQIPILSVLIKTAALNKVSCFEEKDELQNVEDYHLWFKLLNEGFKFASINDRLFFYRIHDKQSTYKDNNLKMQTINMFKLLVVNWNSTTNFFVLQKIKWYLFSNQTHNNTINLIKLIFKNQKKYQTILNLVEKIPSQKLRSKIIFKLCL